MQMADPWRYVGGGFTEHWQDPYVLRLVLDLNEAQSQWTGKRRVHDELGGGLVFGCEIGCGGAGLFCALGSGADGEHGAGAGCCKHPDKRGHCILSFEDCD